jgi:hypothetical protein
MHSKAVLSGFAAALLIYLTGCRSEEHSSEKHRNLCEIGMWCDVPAPSPITLKIASTAFQPGIMLKGYLKRDFGNGAIIFDLGPDRQSAWTDKTGQRHSPLRVYFVTGQKDDEMGSVWILFDHLQAERPKTQTLTRSFNRHTMDIVTDGRSYSSNAPLMLYRIALVDRLTRIGPTFVSGYPQLPYIKHEYNSTYARSDWESAVRSSCGGGPLTAVPASWTDERARDCHDLQNKRDRRKTWYGRLLGP